MRLFLTFLLMILASPAQAAEAPASLERDGAGTVESVIDGDTLVLEDGAEVRLVGLQAPKLALGREGFVEWPLADEAKAALEALTLGRQVTLAYGGLRTDRYGRKLAHLIREDGLWIQGAMLEAGMARVYSFPDNRAAVAEMLALERSARAERRGIWDHPYYAVRAAGEAGRAVGGFELVEGVILAAEEVRGRIYLNFGEDWDRDFTISIEPADTRTFEEAGIDPTQWEGRRVRVRGWLREFNGPLIEATHPEQIEMLDG
ncbi:thermonuclease family protein [Inquilinus sp. CAU 1745]|uniref:thermonuclease family protein n=1 Tax=Inquilinus sp. CAU 1745 TaxID=3140369 RepID=UPI00325AE524